MLYFPSSSIWTDNVSVTLGSLRVPLLLDPNMWVCGALAGANTIAIFLIYPESNFHRPTETPIHVSLENTETVTGGPEKSSPMNTEDLSWHRVSVVQKSWGSIWKTFVTIDHDSNLARDFVQPLFMLSKPSVLFAVFVYGTSLASQNILV